MDFTHLYIDLLVTTGDIGPFLRNIDFPKMIVFLNMLILIITCGKNTILSAVLNIGLGLC